MKKLLLIGLVLPALLLAPSVEAKSHNCNRADINRDGVVNVTDLSILLSNYGRDKHFNHKADINKDGRVDITDLSILLTNYGQSCR